MAAPNENKKYTYRDYLNWPEGEKWEIIDGSAYLQASPTWQHQAVSGELFRQFANYFQGKPCRVFTAPFDLCLPESNQSDEDSSTVVQPDILVACDLDRLKGTGYFGAPELIVEITSNSTNRSDKILKFNRYEKAGIKEYWIVEPQDKFVSVFTLQDNKRYGRPETYTEENSIQTTVFPGLTIDLGLVFSLI